MLNITTAYIIAEDKTVTNLGTYQKAYEAREVCEVRAGHELKWTNPSPQTWEAVSGDALYRLVTSVF